MSLVDPVIPGKRSSLLLDLESLPSNTDWVRNGNLGDPGQYRVIETVGEFESACRVGSEYRKSKKEPRAQSRGTLASRGQVERNGPTGKRGAGILQKEK